MQQDLLRELPVDEPLPKYADVEVRKIQKKLFQMVFGRLAR